MKIDVSVAVIILIMNLFIYLINYSVIKNIIDFLLTSEYTHREKRAVLKAILNHNKKEYYEIVKCYIQKNTAVYEKTMVINKINKCFLLISIIAFLLSAFRVISIEVYIMLINIIFTLVHSILSNSAMKKISIATKPKKKKTIIVNKKLIVTAYIERYVPSILMLVILIFSIEFAFMLMMIYGIYEIIASRCQYEHFLCAMQNTCHKKMTPYKHSQSEINYLCKEGRGAGIVMSVMGFIGFIVVMIVNR